MRAVRVRRAFHAALRSRLTLRALLPVLNDMSLATLELGWPWGAWTYNRVVALGFWPRREAAGESSGDDLERRFRSLFERYYGQVFRFFRRKGMDPEDARDLAQDVFLNVYKSLPSLRQDGQFQSWLFTISANVFKNELERRGARKRASVQVPLEGESQGERDAPSPASRVVDLRPRPMEALLEKEKLERLRSAVTELPEQMQKCLRLRVAEDRSYQEIADALGVSINTVKAHLRQARIALKERLAPYFAEVDVGLARDDG
jgi:RNA polymerase sigma-70 factor (ECF subfamily)